MKMKTARYIIWALLCLAACDRSDPGGAAGPGAGEGGDGLGDNAEANAAILEMNEKYDLSFRYVFDKSELTYNWTETIDLDGMPIEPADPECVAALLGFLDREVFPAFPEGLVQEALPPLIYLVSECNYTAEQNNPPPTGNVPVYLPMAGFPTRNVLILSGAGPSFTPDTETRERYISLIVERMAANARILPPASEFYAVAGPGSMFGPTYWSGNISDPHLYWEEIPSLERGLVWQWQKSFLKMSKATYRYHVMNEDPPFYAIMKVTQGQDLGDYYVFLTRRTQAERDAFYEEAYRRMEAVYPLNWLDRNDPDSAIAKMKQKVQLARTYFNRYFKTDIPASVY